MNAIGAIKLSSSSEIVFYVDTYQGKRYANIRKFITTQKYIGPTKSGIKLTKQQLESIQKVLLCLSNSSEMAQDEELLSIPLGENICLSIRISFYNGSFGLDIRQYISTEKYKGPTKKGVRFPLDCIEQVCIYCQKMLDIFGTIEIESALLDPQDEDQKRQSTIKSKQAVEGVPYEFQKYFE